MSTLLHSILPRPRRPIVYVYPDVSVTQCVELMVQDNIGALVVTDEENLLGVVSERDIVRSLVYKKRAPDETKASDILYADVSVLNVNDTIEDAMEVITTTKRRHVLVADDEELVAIVSIGDLLLHVIEDKTKTIDELKNYIHTY